MEKCFSCKHADCVNCFDRPDTREHGKNAKYSEALVEQVISGKKAKWQLADELGLTESTITKWVKKYREAHNGRV